MKPLGAVAASEEGSKPYTLPRISHRNLFQPASSARVITFLTKYAQKKVKRKGVVLLLGNCSATSMAQPLIGSCQRSRNGKQRSVSAGIAKAVQDKQASSAALAEQERHKAQLKGSGLYLKRGECFPKCKGSGLFLSKKVEPLINFDIERAARSQIQYFRGVFMRDGLPAMSKKKERGVVNLDSSDGGGFHRDGPTVPYFDSYGLDPPLEIARYLDYSVRTQTSQLQGPDDVICGHLCLHVLRELAVGKKIEDGVLRLV